MEYRLVMKHIIEEGAFYKTVCDHNVLSLLMGHLILPQEKIRQGRDNNLECNKLNLRTYVCITFKSKATPNYPSLKADYS